LEYRESTARTCVEQAYRSPGQGAVRYVRRAVELCGDANFTVQASAHIADSAKALLAAEHPAIVVEGNVQLQGLSRGCIQYTQSHSSKHLGTLLYDLVVWLQPSTNDISHFSTTCTSAACELS